MATETVNVVLGNDIVTNANLANVPTNTIKGRVAAGTGDPQDLTADQASTVLDTATDPLMRTSDAVAAFDPLTQNRPNNTTPDLSFHSFPVYDPFDAQSEKADGVSIKSWLAGEFDALGAAAAAGTRRAPCR